jgi:hypothetical protein
MVRDSLGGVLGQRVLAEHGGRGKRDGQASCIGNLLPRRAPFVERRRIVHC